MTARSVACVRLCSPKHCFGFLPRVFFFLLSFRLKVRLWKLLGAYLFLHRTDAGLFGFTCFPFNYPKRMQQKKAGQRRKRRSPSFRVLSDPLRSAVGRKGTYVWQAESAEAAKSISKSVFQVASEHQTPVLENWIEKKR